MKQVVGKKINKKRYVYPLPVSLPGGVAHFTLFGHNKKSQKKHINKNKVKRNTKLSSSTFISNNEKNAEKLFKIPLI